MACHARVGRGPPARPARAAWPAPGRAGRDRVRLSVCDLRPVDARSCTYRVLYHRVAECNAPLRAPPDPPAVDDLATPPPFLVSLSSDLSLSLPNHFSDSKLSQQTQRAGLSRNPRRPIPHLRQLVLNRGRTPARRGATPTPPHRLSGSSPGLPALRSRPPLSLAAPGPIAAFVAPASRAHE